MKKAFYQELFERNNKMTKAKLIVNLTTLLICLLVVNGCDRSAKERNKALAEAEKAKAELAEVNALLSKAQRERDWLKEEMDRIYEEWEQDRSNLAASVAQAEGELQNMVDRLTQERDIAIARAKTAEASVKRLNNEIRELEEWNRELQATIQQFQGQIEQMYEQAGEELYGEPNEQWEQEIADENNV
jgi:predicted  nucleic acid-binding Zn-ribbon protein